MNDFKDVIIHVYQLTDVAPAPTQQTSRSVRTASEGGGSWFTRTFLPAIGLGAYHTSLQIHGYRYTFTGNYGIVKCFSHVELTGLPPNAIFQESIFLGRTTYERGEVNEIVKKFSDKYFKPTSYHLVHRNCNHFTETFATALLLGDRLAEPDIGRLEAYPTWINRLANTGQIVVSKEGDILTCMPVQEAGFAVGVDKKVGGGLTTNSNNSASTIQNQSPAQEKKKLTEAQKAALAKIRNTK
jgi:PPPDE putative peptidase domain